MNKKILTIGITSYNRTVELLRALNSIDASEPDSIEIIVCEDHAPRREEVKQIVEEFSSTSCYDVKLYLNPQNLGFDGNLYNVIEKANSKYVMYLSDDDMFLPGQIDLVIERLKIYSPHVAFCGFQEKGEMRRWYPEDRKIESGINGVRKYYSDAILFSGLIFQREDLLDIDASRFLNCNYIQLYMFMRSIYQFGGDYYSINLIDCISDGENGFGKNETADNNKYLDRSTVFSNLEFQRRIVIVIKMFDEDFGTNVFSVHKKYHQIESFGGLCRAREISKETLKKYWKLSDNVGINKNFVMKVYYFTLLFLGSEKSKTLFSIPEHIYRKIRFK